MIHKTGVNRSTPSSTAPDVSVDCGIPALGCARRACRVGMGLSICRSIIEAHGGRLWATRCEPRGAIFQFTIPAD
jgi:sensor histidine kinase regulating citrate/malate metabolism